MKVESTYFSVGRVPSLDRNRKYRGLQVLQDRSRMPPSAPSSPNGPKMMKRQCLEMHVTVMMMLLLMLMMIMMMMIMMMMMMMMMQFLKNVVKGVLI